MNRVWVHAIAALGGLLGACYGGQTAALQAQATPAKPPVLGKRAASAADDCAPEPGKPAPEPLRIPYSGVAKAARCQREVYTIMGGVTHFLGVACRHCHAEPDYAADTHNKQVANWMARELVPRLAKREAADAADKGVWCKDCHDGKAKFLGDPRRRGFAVEWMTTHLVEDFSTSAGKPPKCKDCHGGDLGSPEFRAKVILSELSGLPKPAEPAAPPSAAPPAPEPAVAPAPTAPTGSGSVPDFGAR